MHDSYLDWTNETHYRHLTRADPVVFAWEWLRRTAAYQSAWSTAVRNHNRARDFGLERFENPSLTIPSARPIWTAAVDPNVIMAEVVDPLAEDRDRVDLRRLSHLVTLFVDQDGVEHILLSDGLHGIRLDVLAGTLIGCPSALGFALWGIAQMRGPIAALNRLATLVATGAFRPSAKVRRNDRFILELRMADALADEASFQEISRAFFGDAVATSRWRHDNPSYRLRIQRLARIARRRLSMPLDQQWFA